MECAAAGTPIVVIALNVYPVKSCAGTALDIADIGPRGIRGDREYMIVDENGGFLTQRELPRMALIWPSMIEGGLRLAAPGVPDLDVPLLADGESFDVTVWRDTCEAVDQGAEVAGWLSRLLGAECRLVRMADGAVRRVDPRYAVRDQDQVGFSDGYPFLLISEESLADLNARLAEPLPMNRFRPNIVVRGGGPYVEDEWRRISIDEVPFDVVKPCARCAITTTDQATARVGHEPLTTLATYRRSERGVLFGQNLVHDGTGAIRVGDQVSVLG